MQHVDHTTSVDSRKRYAPAVDPWRFLREVVETVLLMLFVFWVINGITGRFRIEGDSMLPTLREGEYVLINKFAYYFDRPERGDIIVLHYPRDPSRDFIKRVIGVPGDEIEMSQGQVLVNGVLLDEPYIEAPARTDSRWVVPEGSFFVLGDNRNNSSDSRNWSFLAQEEVVGKAWAIYWPVDLVQFIPHHVHAAVPDSAESP